MGRSVVLAGAVRCPRCSLPLRWCTCGMLPPVETKLAVHVLIHRQERGKPSSTGNLVTRVVAGAACHVFQRESRFFSAMGFPVEAVEAGGELWILHPSGDPPPRSSGAAASPCGSRRHVLLLDGTWRQSGEMLRSVERVGRRTCLPDAGVSPSRYWLRDQPEAGRLSTAEALIGVLGMIGEHQAEQRLRLHFELHVYAMLLARGKRELAERYLGHSPLLAAIPGMRPARALNRDKKTASPRGDRPPRGDL